MPSKIYRKEVPIKFSKYVLNNLDQIKREHNFKTNEETLRYLINKEVGQNIYGIQEEKEIIEEMDNEKMSASESVKEFIQVFLKTTDGKQQSEHFDYSRNDQYTTFIDKGIENLSLRKDVTKIMLYMQNDIITFNNGKSYKVVKREFQPCVPVMLILYVEEIIEFTDVMSN